MLIDFQAGKNKRMQKKLIVFCSKHPVGEKNLPGTLMATFEPLRSRIFLVRVLIKGTMIKIRNKLI